jgi:hypothetical protein
VPFRLPAGPQAFELLVESLSRRSDGAFAMVAAPATQLQAAGVANGTTVFERDRNDAGLGRARCGLGHGVFRNRMRAKSPFRGLRTHFFKIGMMSAEYRRKRRKMKVRILSHHLFLFSRKRLGV